MFPKFSAATLRGKKEHECFVLQSIAKDAVLHVFQEGLTDINVETVELSQGEHCCVTLAPYCTCH